MSETLEDFIFAAAEEVRRITGDQSEAATLVYVGPDGKLAWAEPRGTGSSDKVKAALSVPKGSKLMALIHNHPSDKRGKAESANGLQFSEADVAMAEQLGIPSFIAYGPDMQMRKYLPGVSKIKEIRKGYRTSAGSPFDHIPEVNVTASKLAQVLK